MIKIVLANRPLLLFFAYCFLSILWSETPFVSLKRCVKAVGDVIMILVILTDSEPLNAAKSFFTRVGFVLEKALGGI